MMMDDDIQAVDSPISASSAAMLLPSDVISSASMQASYPVTAGSPNSSIKQQAQQQSPGTPGQSKYAQLLAVIEEMGKDIRPTYAGSKSSAERLKRGIVHARILVRECLMETERSARQ
ncbi:hypothetical protein L9F63_006246 [Diploptera punctata]|uniref:Cyclin-dependent kinase 2-associated protein n=1 Tax=Diploptera punctata TaxID=6984 RepID=A0AAD7ZAN9_DIPPU|nr:hypothetical protein L9F63_006246 [Diploptera punctata]